MMHENLSIAWLVTHAVEESEDLTGNIYKHLLHPNPGRYEIKNNTITANTSRVSRNQIVSKHNT